MFRFRGEGGHAAAFTAAVASAAAQCAPAQVVGVGISDAIAHDRNPMNVCLEIADNVRLEG